MSKRILLGIDTNLSPPTKHALRATSELLEQSLPGVRLILLHVIPVPYATASSGGKSIGSFRPLPPTSEQRLQSERALWRARTVMQQQGISPERIELLQRVGMPADEIVKAARELYVDCIVLGSRGNSLIQSIRRILLGSTSRRVLRLAPCPITLVMSPRTPSPHHLVDWYKVAVTHSLHEHHTSLLVFTAYDVAQTFAPPEVMVGHKELDAAALALQQLADNGFLCCHKVKGELRYIND
jgi:nucleotide-binding universal stress UspA family protein